MTNTVQDIPKDSGKQGITGLASYLLGAVPLIFFVYVLMLADDYALLRVVINQLSLGTLLVICIPLLPLWIAAAPPTSGGRPSGRTLPWRYWNSLFIATAVQREPGPGCA